MEYQKDNENINLNDEILSNNELLKLLLIVKDQEGDIRTKFKKILDSKEITIINEELKYILNGNREIDKIIDGIDKGDFPKEYLLAIIGEQISCIAREYGKFMQIIQIYDKTNYILNSEEIEQNIKKIRNYFVEIQKNIIIANDQKTIDNIYEKHFLENGINGQLLEIKLIITNLQILIFEKECSNYITECSSLITNFQEKFGNLDHKNINKLKSIKLKLNKKISDLDKILINISSLQDFQYANQKLINNIIEINKIINEYKIRKVILESQINYDDSHRNIVETPFAENC